MSEHRWQMIHRGFNGKEMTRIFWCARCGAVLQRGDIDTVQTHPDLYCAPGDGRYQSMGTEEPPCK